MSSLRLSDVRFRQRVPTMSWQRIAKAATARDSARFSTTSFASTQLSTSTISLSSATSSCRSAK